jgi:Sec-independent protein translocase protein TatA
MAKRGSARRSADDEVDDAADDAAPADDMAWGAKKPKKDSGRTGRPDSVKSKKKSADDLPAKSKKDTGKHAGLKDSGKRKKRSAEDEGGDGDDMSSSARRKRVVPKKKQDFSPVMIISAISLTLILCVGIVLMNKGRTPVAGRDDTKTFDEFKKLKEEGLKLFGEFNAAAKTDNAALAQQKGEAAHAKLTEATEKLNALLDNYRRPDGTLPPEYEGHEQEYEAIAPRLVDIEKRITLKRR